MTKNQMIEAIKEKEKKHWELLCTIKEIYGSDSMEASRQSGRWGAIYELCIDLGIEI